MNRIKVNEQFVFEASLKEPAVLNGHSVHFDWTPIDEQHFHVLLNNRSYRAELVGRNLGKRTITLLIEGEHYEVQVLDEFDELVQKMGMNAQNNKITDLKAPMPGLVVRVDVSAGDAVQKDQNLIVLEAMKMENVLKSPSDGVVSEIHVQSGDKVDKNQILISFL